MHRDDSPTTAEQVATLVAEQMPQWAHLPVAPVTEQGTDHCLFRLGEELVARMPRVEWAAGQALRDAAWLPHLAPHAARVGVDLPVPLALGEPTDDYPHPWSVVPWLPGVTPTEQNLDDDTDWAVLAADLGGFVAMLRGVPAAGGPAKRGADRGTHPRTWDDAVRRGIEAAGDRIPTRRVTLAWERILEAPDHQGPPSWMHADLLPGNMLVRDGRLGAVIDWGGLGVGDPAPDLKPYWSVVPAHARAAFREAVDDEDDALWLRGLGWVLAPSLTGLAYYWDTMPAFARSRLAGVHLVLGELGLGD
ncbi:aminoglycoside phosphotransferase family protein [Nocardioides acrostichi]|uniref:Aminoglycoside phosphotransferase family protein n=1 Tax=Nocardioides acrostichi TaxID=2784339 RepID=A0A930Y7K0_9ACTN|nr:aminoglycoside phosphotransferase family protein [Nocardioides acrostichi]MBF4162112.1 aminoglycoside phosphotransferase family protein [Nocardioides acrostichi]